MPVDAGLCGGWFRACSRLFGGLGGRKLTAEASLRSFCGHRMMFAAAAAAALVLRPQDDVRCCCCCCCCCARAAASRLPLAYRLLGSPPLGSRMAHCSSASINVLSRTPSPRASRRIVVRGGAVRPCPSFWIEVEYVGSLHGACVSCCRVPLGMWAGSRSQHEVQCQR